MKRTKFAAAVLIAVLVAVPMFAARGSADFSKLVALGDSYGAGFESGSLNERHQVWSWPAVLAKQVGYRLCTPADTAAADCFAQPLVSFAGVDVERDAARDDIRASVQQSLHPRRHAQYAAHDQRLRGGDFDRDDVRAV